MGSAVVELARVDSAGILLFECQHVPARSQGTTHSQLPTEAPDTRTTANRHLGQTATPCLGYTSRRVAGDEERTCHESHPKVCPDKQHAPRNTTGPEQAPRPVVRLGSAARGAFGAASRPPCAGLLLSFAGVSNRQAGGQSLNVIRGADQARAPPAAALRA